MWMSGSPGSCSIVSPPHPNQSPPVRLSAVRIPTAKPPGAAVLRGREIRFDTQTSRPKALILRRLLRDLVNNPGARAIVPRRMRSRPALSGKPLAACRDGLLESAAPQAARSLRRVETHVHEEPRQ